MFTSTTETSSRIQTDTEHARVLYLMNLAQPQATSGKRYYDWAKRILDIVGALLGLVVFSPLMLLIAIAIRATSPGPAILIQERVGQGGRIFPFYKFRSMYDDPDRSADIQFARDYINGNHRSGIAWKGVFKPANDQRVTPLGRLLRKGSLDELPQLFNVLKGEMSLVGPRPSMLYEVDLYKPWHFRRLEVLPGITGLAQVSGRSSLTFQNIVKIDIEYVGRRSLILDLKILLKTVPTVLSARGAR